MRFSMSIIVSKDTSVIAGEVCWVDVRQIESGNSPSLVGPHFDSQLDAEPAIKNVFLILNLLNLFRLTSHDALYHG